MRQSLVLKTLGELASSQWGLLTTAQAADLGISRLQLARLTDAGQLERLEQGVYRMTSAPTDRFEALRSAWLSLNPGVHAETRLAPDVPDAVVSGSAAAWLHGIGELVPEPYLFTVPVRRQTQRTGRKLRVRVLEPDAVTIREGLPVTTVEQTLADLLELGLDRSLVAQALADVESLDHLQIVAKLSPLAARLGFRPDDGQAVLNDLERLAGRDLESLAQTIANSLLAPRIAELLADKPWLTAEMRAAMAGFAEAARLNNAAQVQRLQPVFDVILANHVPPERPRLAADVSSAHMSLSAGEHGSRRHGRGHSAFPAKLPYDEGDPDE